MPSARPAAAASQYAPPLAEQSTIIDNAAMPVIHSFIHLGSLAADSSSPRPINHPRRLRLSPPAAASHIPSQQLVTIPFERPPPCPGSIQLECPSGATASPIPRAAARAAFGTPAHSFTLFPTPIWPLPLPPPLPQALSETSFR
ncbi:hypothetical protein CDD82_1996 [Ophiocordyceps australis]|uniref:Uncharacterized protein n=1 Tax=Ophiocordyceps australis TaxID=1399860 RepID=A0A2C5ZKX7_9HYPO|nr:hypothetical protein CDD82_1996 [Ophiocordyceps australis]